MLIIKQISLIEYDWFNNSQNKFIFEYFVFNDEDEFIDHKMQQELLNEGVRQITYDKLHINVVKLFPLSAFENTSIEQFTKLQKLLDK